jgi:predicted nucleic acid-binding protein
VGPLTLPGTGVVYLDANPVIYSVEKHPVFGPLLQPVWQAAQSSPVEIVSSELVLLEVLVGPLKAGDSVLADTYEQLFQQPQTRLIPISLAVLREAARIRATTTLRTPDAVHAATALLTGCALFVTNDVGFRSIAKLPVVILDDLVAP